MAYSFGQAETSRVDSIFYSYINMCLSKDKMLGQKIICNDNVEGNDVN